MRCVLWRAVVRLCRLLRSTQVYKLSCISGFHHSPSLGVTIISFTLYRAFLLQPNLTHKYHDQARATNYVCSNADTCSSDRAVPIASIRSCTYICPTNIQQCRR
jgi:hypothetical protein